jgi:N-acetylglucosamine transport system substrate-binding protein
MSLSPEHPAPIEAETESNPFRKPGLDRRSMLRRAAAVSLVAVPGVGFLDACATGGGGGATPAATGSKDANNPLGVDPKAPLEVVIFSGGYGDGYAKNVHVPLYKKAFPNATVTETATQEISTTLQPRFNGGNPPDVIDNSGTKQMEFGALVDSSQLQELTDLWAAPSVDDPSKTVKDVLLTGTIDQGMFNGKSYVFNYVSTVYGLWYNAKLWATKGWKPPTTWADFITTLDTIKAAGITPIGYAGANASYYLYLVILTSAAKLGGADILKNIDNLTADAWTNDSVHKSAEAWAAIGAKYTDKSFLGLKHTEVQLKQNQDKVGIYPSGNWLENEQKAVTPATFEYAMFPIPSLTTSDKLPVTAVWAGAGEPFIVAAKGKNPKGGMEYFRRMLTKEGAQGFTKETGSLTVLQGASEGLTLPPGMKSSATALTAAGKDTFYYTFDGWYKYLDTELRAATNELFYGGGTADKFVTRMQKKSDAIKADSSVKKFTR